VKKCSEWMTLANINCLGEEMFGFISNMAVTRIAKEKLLQKKSRIYHCQLLLKKR